MLKYKWSHKSLLLIMILISCLIMVTKAFGLTYNMEIHPDEAVFYKSTSSLYEAIIHPGQPFVEVKEYPEGTYIFQLPFNFLARIARVTTDAQKNVQIWGRISSVFYFICAVNIGMLIMWQYLGKNYRYVVCYGLTMCFSLFFIEHARYGVGDMISLCLLMMIIFLSAKAFSSGLYLKYLILACVAAGAMGAVKYPQLFFILIPIVSYARVKTESKKKVLTILLFITVGLVAFLLFSPKAIFDWGYFLRVIEREGEAYVTGGTAFEDGGLLNHIVGMVFYTLLYSDMPLSALLVAGCFIEGFKKFSLTRGSEQNKEDLILFLFRCVVPSIFIVFFAYNLFIKLLIFRTYTPFFGISALYASYWAVKLYERNGKAVKIAILGLVCAMVLRGSALIYITSSEDRLMQTFNTKVQAAVDGNWNRTVELSGYVIPFDKDKMINYEKYPIEVYAENNEADLKIKPGTLIITGAYEHGFAGDYILPCKPGDDFDCMNLWDTFKKENADYYVDQLYPDFFYYVFGGWIRGGTLSTSLIPCNMIYYRSN